jgi:hypothetical protein
MKTASVALVIAAMLLTAPQAEASDRGSASVVSSTIAGLMASAQGSGLHLATAPAIYGYGYRPTYYGNGFSYQPAYYPAQAYYVTPRFRGCCRW